MRDDDFEALYAEHAEGLFSFLAYRTGDRSLAEDLLADTFERALRHRRRFDLRRGSRKTWLYAIAVNVLRDHLRRRAVEAGANEQSDRLAPVRSLETDAVENRDLVSRALEALSSEEREAIALRFGADLSLPEMAKLLGEPLTTMEGRVYRALRKLRDPLGG
jgi:RNA polymerase sigma-70 factor (ECF subfamily)